MQESRSDPDILPTPTSNRKCRTSKTFELEQQQQTESSVYEYYQKVKTRQDAYKNKIATLETRVLDVLYQHQMQIKEEKVKLLRLNFKWQEKSDKSQEAAIFWKNSIEEIETTMSYFLSKLKDFHEAEQQKIVKNYEQVLSEIEARHKQQTQSLTMLLKRIKNTKIHCRQIKQEVKSWISQNLTSLSSIKQVEQQISKTTNKYKKIIEESRNRRQKQAIQFKKYFEELKNVLEGEIRRQKIERENNKEQILQIFQKMQRGEGVQDFNNDQ